MGPIGSLQVVLTVLTFLNRCVGDGNSWNRTVRFDVKFDVD